MELTLPLHAPDLIFFLAKVRLAYLDSFPPHNLVIWTDGSVRGVFTNCSFCGTEATLFFLAGPLGSSFSLEACVIQQALRNTNKSAITLLLLSDSRSVVNTLPSPLSSFYLKLSNTSGRNCLLSQLLSGYNGSPDTHFFQERQEQCGW